jgi:PAS domain S-box-containing protein
MPSLREASASSGRFLPSQESLQLALGAAQAGIWEWHLGTNQNLWSDEVWRLYGLDPALTTASFDSWLYSIHPQDRTHARQTVAAASQCRVPFEVEWRTNPETGPVRWIMSRGQPGHAHGKGAGSYIGIVMDITARKTAEQAAQQLAESLEQRVQERTAALGEHERMLQHILDSVPGLVGYWNKDLVNGYANIAYSEWFGLRPEQIRGKHIRELLGEDIFERNWPYIKEALAGKPQRFERLLPVPSQPGEFRHSQAHYLPDIAHGHVRGFLVMVFDISQVKQAELGALAANQAKSEFLANISHEVRTPLNAMFGLAQVGARQAAGTPSSRTFAQILDAARHLLSLVNDVLDFSKIEAGKLSIVNERVDLGAVLDHLMSLKAVRAHGKGLQLSLEEANTLPSHFMGDATRLSQILLNLVSNAIKFTNQGEVKLTLSYEAPVLTLAVRDTGVGIQPGDTQRMFLPFEQFNNQASKEGGTGLGLSITKCLVDMMKGRIEVDTHAGRGSTFTVQLPIEDAEWEDLSPLNDIWLIGLPQAQSAPLAQALKARGCRVQSGARMPPPGTPASVFLLDADTCGSADEATLRQRLSEGTRLLIAAPPGRIIDLPSDLQEVAQVLSGPLCALRLLHALRVAPQVLASSAFQRLSGLQILAAEDNPINRLVLGEMLEQEGALVTFAQDGAQAVAQVQAQTSACFDIVLCDIQMPLLDGYQATKAIKELVPDLPVVGLTAHAFESAKQQAWQVGMVGYVTKPYMLDTLVAEILRHARKRPSDQPAPAASQAPPGPSMTPEPTMHKESADWQAMQQYFREQPQLLDKLIGMLNKTLSGIEQELAQAMSHKDLPALAKVAHNIKGTALNLHTPELARLAVQTQDQARQLAQEALDTAQSLSVHLHDFIDLVAAHQATHSDTAAMPLLAPTSTTTTAPQAKAC